MSRRQLRLDLSEYGPLLTADDMAQVLKLDDRRTVIEWCRGLDWPNVEIRRRLYFTHDQVHQIVAAHEKVPARVASPEAAMPAQGLTIAGQTKRSSARRTA